MYKYKEVAKEIANNIESKVFSDRLPSVRNLMAIFQVSQSTIEKALKELVTKNKIYVQKNVGYFVVYKAELKNLDTVYDFTTTSTSWTDFPFEDYMKCLEETLKYQKEELFTYGNISGNTELKKALAEHLAGEHIFTDSTHLAITNGSIQALYILLNLMSDHESILIEQPNYHLLNRMIERLGVDYAVYHRENFNFDIEEFEKLVKKHQPKFVYLMPRLHNPLGVSMTRSEKEKVVFLAEKYNFYIIEDDYLSDFEYYNKYQTLYELDMNDRVIYLRSFSKIMFPGQRLGLSILPENFYSNFIKRKEIIDYQTNEMTQLALLTFLRSGLYQYHKDTIVANHKERAQLMKKSLMRNFQSYEYNCHNQLHSLIKLSPRVDMDNLLVSLREKNILVDNYKNYYLQNYRYKNKFLKINVSNIEKNKIEDGIAMVKESIKSSIRV